MQLASLFLLGVRGKVKCECSLSDTYWGVRRIACPDSTRFAGCRAPAAYCPAGRPRSGDSCLHPLGTFSYSLKHINGQHLSTKTTEKQSGKIQQFPHKKYFVIRLMSCIHLSFRDRFKCQSGCHKINTLFSYLMYLQNPSEV